MSVLRDNLAIIGEYDAETSEGRFAADSSAGGATGAARATGRRGFTLLELMITVTIITLGAAAVLPSFQDDNRVRLIAAASILQSDIEYAQVMNISYPGDPVVVRFVPNRDQYYLAYESDPTTPITRDDTGDPYLVTLGEGRAASAEGVSLTLADVPADTLSFNPQGGLADFTINPVITLARDGDAIALLIAPATGSITAADP